MPIDQKQRDKNTHNKLLKVIKDAPTRFGRNPTTKHGTLGRHLESAAKGVDMDEATGSHDYSGSALGYNHDKALISTVRNFATTGNKRRAISALDKAGYGQGYDMTEHGEGKSYGDKS